MILHDYTHKNTVIQNFLNQLRDETIQKDRMRFRRNIERVGEFLSYELSKSLSYDKQLIKSPLGTYHGKKINDDLVICSILRAGIPMHQGVLNVFDHAENGYISAYRKTNSDNPDFEIVVEYLASPNLENKTLLIVDPMLATGKSMVSVYETLQKLGKPKAIHVLSVLGAKEGFEYLNKKLPEPSHLWIAQIDKKLNEKGYIVPGLGDAGDLSFGPKL